LHPPLNNHHHPRQAPFLSADSTLAHPKLLPQTGVDIILEKHPQNSRQPTNWIPAELVQVITLPTATRALFTLLGNGCAGWDYAGSLTSCGGLRTWEAYTAVAVLYARVPPHGIDKSHQQLWSPCIRSAQNLCRGQPVWVAASPFGLVSPEVFCTSLSSGIVSNTIPSGSPVIIVTDARGLAGSEGGAVVDSDGRLAAMLAPPLQRTDGTTSSLSICIAAEPIWRALKHNLDISGQNPAILVGAGVNHRVVAGVVEKVSRSVAAVRVGSLWGSGVVISSSGFILTNAHILRPSLNPSGKQLAHGANLRVCINHEWHKASLVFVACGTLDVAVIKAGSLAPLDFMDIDPSLEVTHKMPNKKERDKGSKKARGDEHGGWLKQLQVGSFHG